MRRSPLLMLLPLSLGLSASGQSISAPAPANLKDPSAILAAAAPLYNFNDPTLKPWHFKASYQLYDESDKPAEQGEFEYWWASPTLWRRTWTRGLTTRSEWHTADGKKYEVVQGNAIHVFEYELPDEWMAPLLQPNQNDARTARLQRDTIRIGNLKLPCVRLTIEMPLPPPMQTLAREPLATECFDPKLPVLILKQSANDVRITYANFQLLQQRALPRSIIEDVNGHRILTATVEQANGLEANSSSLVPPANRRRR